MPKLRISKCPAGLPRHRARAEDLSHRQQWYHCVIRSTHLLLDETGIYWKSQVPCASFEGGHNNLVKLYVNSTVCGVISQVQHFHVKHSVRYNEQEQEHSYIRCRVANSVSSGGDAHRLRQRKLFKSLESSGLFSIPMVTFLGFFLVVKRHHVDLRREVNRLQSVDVLVCRWA